MYLAEAVLYIPPPHVLYISLAVRLMYGPLHPFIIRVNEDDVRVTIRVTFLVF